MHLMRDLLDSQVRDRDNRRMGRVDGIVLVTRAGRPPRVAYLELGLPTLLARISTRLAGIALAAERRLGVTTGKPQRIDISRVEGIGIDVRVNIDARRTDVYAWERWVGRVFIDRIPGAPRAASAGGRRK